MKKLNFKNQTKLFVVSFAVLVVTAIALCVLTTGTANAYPAEKDLPLTNVTEIGRTQIDKSISECQEGLVWGENKIVGKVFCWYNCSPYTIDKDSLAKKAYKFDAPGRFIIPNMDLASVMDDEKYKFSDEDYIDYVYITWGYSQGLCVVADYHSDFWDDVKCEYTVKAANKDGVVIAMAEVSENEWYSNTEPTEVENWEYFYESAIGFDNNYKKFFDEGGFVTISQLRVLD